MKKPLFSFYFFALVVITSNVSCKEQSANKFKRPEPAGWYSGDMHVHRNCGSGDVKSVSQLTSMMEENDLDVISVLADMGNGEVKYSTEDLLKVNGQPAPESKNGRIVQWDVEWHWDATYSEFSNQALGGHLVLLGLNNAKQIWSESPYKVLEWGKKQGAVAGFAHMEYLNDSIQNNLNCCIPLDYPVEAALGTVDFISEDVFAKGSPNNGNYFADGAINAYYKLLNCGFRLSLVAGTDYPCNAEEPLGKMLTYVNVADQKITYPKWVDGIKKGKTVVSRNAHNEFIDLKFNNVNGPGDVITMNKGDKAEIEITWTANQDLNGTIELVKNGRVIGIKEGNVKSGNALTLSVSEPFSESSWICARRMSPEGHMVHTSAIYINIDNKPVRASAADAGFFADWIKNLLENIQPGAKWNKYFPKDYDEVSARYRHALNVYNKIKEEASH